VRPYVEYAAIIVSLDRLTDLTVTFVHPVIVLTATSGDSQSLSVYHVWNHGGTPAIATTDGTWCIQFMALAQIQMTAVRYAIDFNCVLVVVDFFPSC